MQFLHQFLKINFIWSRFADCSFQMSSNAPTSVPVFYILLLTLRVGMVFLPQSGYIHPDEHFQCPEIAYGDLFKVQTLRTWEFTSTKPVRSISFPYFIIGISVFIMKILRTIFYGTEIYIPYLLLILPRLIMCLISFIHDLSLFKLCLIMKKNPKPVLTVFGSSYVVLVYYSRTFSNCIESIFFTFILYITYKEINNMREKLKSNFQIYLLLKNNIKIAYILSTIIAAGFFTRPSFLFFALSPMLYWLFYASKTCSKLIHMLTILIGLIFGAISFSFVLVIIDSFYYNKMHYKSISMTSAITWKNIVFSPLNFILYNMENKNLITHGEHPKFLHALINMPQLFSILGIFLFLNFASMLYYLLIKKTIVLNHFMITSSVIPIVFLSLFPHQEPRFIIPILFPLAYLYGGYICNGKSKLYIIIWTTTNILGLVYFGILHQGGLFSALSFLHTQLPKTGERINILFSRTYMAPRYLLAIPDSFNTVAVNDLSGADVNSFNYFVNNNTMQSQSIYVVTQHGLLPNCFLQSTISTNYTYNFLEEVKFFPHVSMENFPDLENFMDVVHNKTSIFEKLCKLKDMFSLSVYVFQKHIK